MIVSAPIVLLTLIVLEINKYLLDEENPLQDAMDLSTNPSKINHERINQYFNTFLKELKYERVLQKAVASYLFIYFENLNHTKLCDKLLKIVKNIDEDVSNLDKHKVSFALGIISTCLMNDVMINNKNVKFEFPPTVKSAMKYIESEGFKIEAWKDE